MDFRIRHIATRFALILAFAAALPLVAYGLVSLVSLQRGTRESIVTGNQNVAGRAAEEIRRYVTTNVEILKTVAADLQGTDLAQWQQDRILKNYVLQFREFREITLYDESRGVIATSRIGRPRIEIPANAPISIDGAVMSSVRVDQDLLPTSIVGIHLMRLNEPAGWLVGEFSLEEMWRMVDAIRLGSRGYALVVAPDGQLIAHGDPDKKTLIAQSKNLSGHHPLVGQASLAGQTPWSEYVDEDGVRQLSVAAPIPTLGWTVIVEQPTDEAYASALVLRRQLTVAIVAALFVMVGLGLLFGRRFIAPIFKLQRGTQAVAEGKLETRVEIGTVDEFGKLGDAFNSMAARLIALQEDVKRQERQAMFGRIVGGLFHDLAHPVQNVGNHAQLLLRADSDEETREVATRTIQREVAALKRFIDDLRNVSKPKPVERFPLDVNGSVAEVVESMRPEGQRLSIAIETDYASGPLVIEGDRFALARVYRNLITNGLQATESGGRVSIETRRSGPSVEIQVSDTGSGIPADRLPTIFDNFVTTKRRGLGLGLAICKQIVEQLGGTIAVTSVLGRGTTFTMKFPARDDLSVQEAAS